MSANYQDVTPHSEYDINQQFALRVNSSANWLSNTQSSRDETQTNVGESVLCLPVISISLELPFT